MTTTASPAVTPEQLATLLTFAQHMVEGVTPQLRDVVQAVTAPPARHVDHGDGTVTDTHTNLMWSKATLSTKCVDHATAAKICADLDGHDLGGHGDWRLPTRAELLTLVDDTRVKPAIDVSAFPDTKNDFYWTGTAYAAVSSYAWIVNFSGGFSYYYRRGNNYAFVRAVRSVPAGQ